MAKVDNIRKFIRKTLNEYITPKDLKNVEDYADDLFSDVGVDVEFTHHFLDRVNDLRNKQDITPEELKWLYQKAYDRYSNMISKLNPGEERVLTDPDTQINIPFAIDWNGKSPDKDMVAKTVMRKKDFKSYTPKLTLENPVDEDINVPINVGDTVLGGRFKNKKIVVKDIGKNEKGDITINNKPLLKVRIGKQLKEQVEGKIKTIEELIPLKSGYARLYHYTHEKNVDSICKNGLDPTRSYDKFGEGEVIWFDTNRNKDANFLFFVDKPIHEIKKFAVNNSQYTIPFPILADELYLCEAWCGANLSLIIEAINEQGYETIKERCLELPGGTKERWDKYVYPICILGIDRIGHY